MTEEEKLNFATNCKAKAGELFKQGRMRLAKWRYQKAVAAVEDVVGMNEERRKVKGELMVLCNLNLAAVALKDRKIPTRTGQVF